MFGATWNEAVESCCSFTVSFGQVDSYHSRASMAQHKSRFVSQHDNKRPGLDRTHGHFTQQKVKNISGVCRGILMFSGLA